MVDFSSLDAVLLVALAIVGVVIFLKVVKYILLVAVIAAIYFAWKLGLFSAIGVG